MKLENYSKGLFLFCGLILIVIGVPRLFLNDWVMYSEYLFFIALVLFFGAMAFSYKIILEFFSMRTTKYGMNMGTLMLLGVVLYICINFFVFRYDKSIDITGGKINSLSLQSLEVLDSLGTEVEFKVYYQGKVHGSQNIGLKLLFKKYLRESSKIKTFFVDAHKDPTSSQVLKREDKGKVVVFLKQGGRTERVREPIGEETITSALFRLGRADSKVIYFLTGHGERSIKKAPEEGNGVFLLGDSLRAKGLIIKELNLLQAQKIPEDAGMIAILGPKKALLQKEILKLKEYIVHGGRLLLASDPSQQGNLNELSKGVGITIQKNFLLATQTVAGADAMSVLGQDFDQSNPITQDIDENAITLFYEATGLKKEGSKFSISEMVKTPPVIIPVQNLENYQVEVQGKKPEAVTVAMTVKGTFKNDSSEHDHGEGEGSMFLLAVFGDSDFMTDAYFQIGFNKDLALNTFAKLLGETNLISIRPRAITDTKFVLTTANSAFVLIFPILIPLVFLVIAAIVWFRKRGA